MKIVAGFTPDDINRMIQERIRRIDNAVLLILQRIGELFVTDARNTRTYKDHTGNLRSSIGYVVLYNGDQLAGDFRDFPAVDVQAKAQSGKNGSEEAKKVINEIKAAYPKGFVFIAVAGMEYAAAVESRNYDVITASSIESAEKLKGYMAQLQQKLENG